jgi:cation efflux family protein
MALAVDSSDAAVAVRAYSIAFPSRRGSQVVRQRSAKPLFAGSIPARASLHTNNLEEPHAGLLFHIGQPVMAIDTAALQTIADAALIRRGLRLNYLSLGYNAVEAGVALMAGLVAGSVSLTGFGIDSVVEVTASVAAQWRLRANAESGRLARAERRTHQIVGVCFLALAAWVAYEAIKTLLAREAPARSVLGIIVLTLSVIIMPLLARAKRRVAQSLGSGALRAEAKQTAVCAYLSAIALVGVGLNTVLGWWWADPVAALAMAPIITKEGLEGLRAEPCAECCGD